MKSTIKNKLHLELLSLIKKNSGTPTQHTHDDGYLGNSHYRYEINIPTLRALLKEWTKQHASISSEELIELINSLVRGESATEKTSAGLLMGYFPAQRKNISPSHFHDWLDHVEGWAEIDGLCQGNFTHTEFFEHWKEWKKTIISLSKSTSIEKRRASISLLITPLLGSNDERLAELTLAVVEQTKHEKDILITKAISWVLRSLVKHQKQLVKIYVEENKKTLPSIVVREVMIKIKTGTKGGARK